MSVDLAKWIPWLPLLGAVLCGICCMKPALRKLAGPISVGLIFLAFLLSVAVYPHVTADGASVVHAFQWIHVGDLAVNFAYFMDPLTLVMLFVVTGIGSLVALYATGYMAGDRGYARFFAAVSLFIFAMTTLVMADNLVLLFLGWEGVGLCSYLLIGYYYGKPTAAAAAKKAFIVNRIGDLGFVLAIFLAYQSYGTVALWTADNTGILQLALARGGEGYTASAADLWLPFLLMIGAFGKSAQIPLYVWLPDAMEGPTPVSALIHAATMVTAGVYLIARTLPLFELSPWALPVVALVGGLTAIFAATIALCQYDIKRIWAYSTVSQLGYMFLGLGALSSVGAVFHLYTHAFFKALLFLTAGSVMHAMAGQLDLRKMSGLRHKMPVTCTLMGIGALALAGFPVITAGFFSKDMILAYTLERGLDHGVGPAGPTWYIILAVLGLVTAFLTAFYTFRLWFRVFWGPEQYEMGEEHHGVDELAPGHPHDAEQQAADQPHHAPAHAAAEHGAHGGGHDHHDAPHEMPWWPMNLPLAVLAVGAIAAGWVMFLPSDHSYGWIGAMVDGSTAHVAHEAGEHAAPTLLGMDLHLAMQLISGVIAIAGIALAAYFHLVNRDAATRVADAARPVVRVLEGKYYIDELYDAVLVRPLRLLGQVFFLIDQLLINGLVYSVAWTPRLLGYSIRPLQHGKLQGYGLGMAGGVAVVALIVWVMIAP